MRIPTRATSISTLTPGPLVWAAFPKLTYSRSLLRLLTGIHVSKNAAQKRCSNPCESSREHCFVRLVLREAERAERAGMLRQANAKQLFPGTVLGCL